MERNWSDTARNVLAAYPWSSREEKERAIRQAELVSFGEQVEVDDLPLALRQWQRRQAAKEQQAAYVWRGESWDVAVANFEKTILEQVVNAHRGNLSAAARALQTTRRVVAYKARKYGLVT